MQIQYKHLFGGILDTAKKFILKKLKRMQSCNKSQKRNITW